MSIFRVERKKRRATLLVKGQGEKLDKDIMKNATEIAYETRAILTIYRDEEDSLVILFSVKDEDAIKRIEDFYNGD